MLQNQKSTRKFKELSREDLFQIYNEYHSGIYYVKEICEKHNISNATLHRVVNEVQALIDYNLHGKKTDNM